MNLPRCFHGIRPKGKKPVVTVSSGGDNPSRVPLEQVVCHSPGGFEWGYGGSGPADLALSMATLVIGKERDEVEIGLGKKSAKVGARAWAVHQYIKTKVIAVLRSDEFRIPLPQIERLIAEFERSRE